MAKKISAPTEAIDVNLAVRSMLRTILDLQTQLTAFRLALEDQHVLTPFVKEAAMLRAMEIWEPRRKALEALGSNDASLLQHILQDTEGPVQ